MRIQPEAWCVFAIYHHDSFSSLQERIDESMREIRNPGYLTFSWCALPFHLLPKPTHVMHGVDYFTNFSAAAAVLSGEDFLKTF